jgi:FixJ family two-component response regulator
MGHGVLEKQSMAAARTVLVVDDDPNVLVALSALLAELSSFAVLSALGFDAAIEHLQTQPVHVLVADAILPTHSGEELAHVARAQNVNIAIVLTSADWRSELLPQPSGTVFLPKPFGLEQVLEALKEAIANVA